jgi:hypothetical protein
VAWRNCQASLTFVAGVNARWPARDKASDGTIGDAAHATRTSDHNPWVVLNGQGIVRARDVDVDGVDAAWCVEELRKLGRAGDPRLVPGGYVISNRRITKPDFSGWSVYTGNYLDQTAAVVHAAGRQMGVAGDADGRNVGPGFKRALWARGARW